MADNRTIAQLLQVPTERYEDAIVIPEINANFELKHGLINLVQNKQFFGHDKEDPHAHTRYFNKITSTMRFSDIPSTSIKLMLFSFSLEGSARIWLEKEPPRSILTWDDLVSKFINQFFPPSKTTNLRNEITRFQQRFDESFYEAWDRFNDLLRACPHHGFFELHQLDTFYNALNANDQDSLNSAVGGNFLDKMPRECLRIIESKSKVCNSRNKAVVAKVSSNSSTPGISPDVAALTTEVSELNNLMKTMLIDKQKAQAPAPVKAVEQSCVTCGGAHSYRNFPATDGNVYRDNIQEYVSQVAAANFNQGNSNSIPPMVSNQIRPPGFPLIQNNQNHFNQNQGSNFNQNRGTNFNQNRGCNFNQGQVYQPPTNQNLVYQAPTPQMQGVSKTGFENYVKVNDVVLQNMQNQGQGTLPSQTVTNPREHVNVITTRSGKTCEGPSTPLVPTTIVSTPLKEPEHNPETSMDKAKKTVQEPNSPELNSYQPKPPYPERMKVREKDTPSAQQSRFMKLFKKLRLEICLKDALIEMPKFNKWLSTLLRNKEKLEEIAITTVNAKCSAIILNKVPEKLEDPGNFLIPCALQELDRTNALADSEASINLLPHSIYKQLGLGALKPTRMTLELANCFVTHPMGIAKDVVVRVDGFTFLADFVVVNFEPDPRVPIILGRPFLHTAKALIDLYEEKLTLRVESDELVFYAKKSEKSKNKQFAHAISIIDFSKDEPFSGSTTNHSNALPPSSSPVKTSDNLEEFTDELTLLKKGVHEENFQVYSNSLFEFDDNFTSSNVNPLFNKMVEDDENENSNISNSDKPVFFNTPLSDKVECSDPEDNIDEIDAFLAMEVSSNFEEGYYDLEGDVIFLKSLLSDDTTHNLAPEVISVHEPKQNESIHNTSITFSPRNDPLHHEFAGELLTLSSRIAHEHEEYLSLMTVLFEISTSRSQENVHANPSSIIESLPESHIPVEDSDPVQEEIDIFVVLDDLIPPGVDNDDSEDEDNSTFLPENESSILEPSALRPPSEPPDVKIYLEPDTAMKNDEDFSQREIVLSLNVEDVNSFTFFIWTFLPSFTYPEDSPVILSFSSEDLIFDPGIFIFHFSYLEPVVFSMEISYSKYCSP
ncbi:reverse transcriptase domain-containing protein [Tanacetum coccineum]|uniref:Reverse transcriptase domain-containing protein n=1 Tax=Tanacetum coccineum TaxID=301880 RepID=A0ABQ4ZSG9_9ASTR